MELKILEENIGLQRPEWVRIMLCQTDFGRLRHKRQGRLSFVEDCEDNRIYIRDFLEVASRYSVNLLIFPELSIPSGFINELFDFSQKNNTIIIAGSYYKQVENGYISICPIITPNKRIIETHKMNPAPSEISSFHNGLIPGQQIYKITNSTIGNFAVTICLDFTCVELKQDIDLNSLDMLIVPAFNSKSTEFFHSMHSDVQNSSHGLYVLYSNMFSLDNSGDGHSALFGVVDDKFRSEFEEQECASDSLRNGIYIFKQNQPYCVFSLNINQKKPLVGRNIFTKPNVDIIDQGNHNVDDKNDFLKKIGSGEEKYRNVDKYYVKPKEYEEMKTKLDREHILIITGDPGIGKTYTAVQLLFDYYNNGYTPKWFSGLSEKDRDDQKDNLQNYEPQEREIVYLEDPFGRTSFENRDELKTIFRNVVERFSSCNSKLIITSRSEIFKQFKLETLVGDEYDLYKNEMNIRTPSYSKKSLIQIADNYISSHTDWENRSPLLIKIIHDGINRKELLSPLMIFNIIRNNSSTHTPSKIKTAIKRAKNADLVEQFAEEIKHISTPSKILLFLVFVSPKKTITFYDTFFQKIQSSLIQSDVSKSTIHFELKNQEGHRLQRKGQIIPVYGFSHPAYEEALAALIGYDRECTKIVEVCFSSIIRENGSSAVEIFRRFINRYPDVTRFFYNNTFKEEIKNIPEIHLIELARQMLLSDIEDFHTFAKQLYPIERLISELTEEKRNAALILKLRLINRRKEELAECQINWESIFSEERISRMHPSDFLRCIKLAIPVNPNLINDITHHFKKTDIIKKYLLLKDRRQRSDFLNVFKDTIHEKTCIELLKNIPEEVFNDKINRKKYTSVLKQYLFHIEQSHGEIHVDDGALRAMQRGANLFPIGVLSTAGTFTEGDLVVIKCVGKPTAFLSVVEMSSDDIIQFKGLHSAEIIEKAEELRTTIISKPQFRMTISLSTPSEN